jgi:pyrroloquinoline-quinone synthase
MSWISRIDDVVADKHLLKHPFYVAWTEGRLSQETLQRYAEQYYSHVAAFPRYLSAIHTQTEDIQARQILLENLNDEEAGADNHPELWLRFAEAVGTTRDAVRAAAPLPETEACDVAYRDIAGARGPIAGLAALYAYESMIPAVSTTKIDGLKTHYGLDTEDALRFFEVHIEADDWHAEVTRGLLENATPEEQDACVAAAADAMDAINLLLDGVVREYCPEVAAA